MDINISQSMWEESMRKYRMLRKELGSQPTERLQGMVDTYSRMQSFVGIKSLLGSDDMSRLRMGKRLLTQRDLSKLTEEGLREESSEVHPLMDFIQSTIDSFGYNSTYARREIALDLLGERKGKPYFVVQN